MRSEKHHALSAELIGAAGLMHLKEVTSDYLMCRDASGKAMPFSLNYRQCLLALYCKGLSLILACPKNLSCIGTGRSQISLV
jgi:hypothetical protein